jgi:hypothetical protein
MNVHLCYRACYRLLIRPDLPSNATTMPRKSNKRQRLADGTIAPSRRSPSLDAPVDDFSESLHVENDDNDEDFIPDDDADDEERNGEGRKGERGAEEATTSVDEAVKKSQFITEFLVYAFGFGIS